MTSKSTALIAVILSLTFLFTANIVFGQQSKSVNSQFLSDYLLYNISAMPQQMAAIEITKILNVTAENIAKRYSLPYPPVSESSYFHFPKDLCAAIFDNETHLMVPLFFDKWVDIMSILSIHQHGSFPEISFRNFGVNLTKLDDKYYVDFPDSAQAMIGTRIYGYSTQTSQWYDQSNSELKERTIIKPNTHNPAGINQQKGGQSITNTSYFTGILVMWNCTNDTFSIESMNSQMLFKLQYSDSIYAKGPPLKRISKNDLTIGDTIRVFAAGLRKGYVKSISNSTFSADDSLGLAINANKIIAVSGLYDSYTISSVKGGLDEFEILGEGSEISILKSPGGKRYFVHKDILTNFLKNPIKCQSLRIRFRKSQSICNDSLIVIDMKCADGHM